jgi:Raf kinase inhibitor-like YbhB/YbcL family protein
VPWVGTLPAILIYTLGKEKLYEPDQVGEDAFGGLKGLFPILGGWLFDPGRFYHSPASVKKPWEVAMFREGFKFGALLAGAWMLMAGQGMAASMQLTSPDVKNGATMSNEQVFNSFGCSGGNLSPELHWTAGPEGTQSYVISCYDPDAPTGSGWWHWVVFDIPADVTSLPKGFKADDTSIAGLIQSRTDFGKPGYGGPCPPPGKAHHYIFRAFALKVKSLASLGLTADSSPAMVGFYCNANKLAEAKLVGMYGR